MNKQTSKAILLLPALTSVVVLALFALQALQVPGAVPEDHSHHRRYHQQARDPHTASAGELPVLGKIAGFELTERSEAKVSQAQLQGTVWIANFIFTSCQDECPLMSLEMQKLQSAFADQPAVKLVSFSVDPETDTPAVLRDYADKFKADPTRWLFLTGPRDVLYPLAMQSFKLPVQDLKVPEHEHKHEHGQHHGKEHSHAAPSQADGPGPSPFLHSQKFVLVDQSLQIRGYYDSTDASALENLVKRDLPRLFESSH